ncbi:MAG TPA: DUF5991 domain-containing protein [Chitinophagaceae bacterium]|nr:DUF5991 domain-containing protein [Chitinophagaceae bacterium]
MANKFFAIVLALSAVTLSCNSSKPGDLQSWEGRYEYEENPRKAGQRNAIRMDWDLIIFEDSGKYSGSLGIQGHETDVIYTGDIVGNDNEVSYIFDRTSIGESRIFKRGDTLFTLVRDKNEFITRWRTAQPKLLENPPAECNCFKKTNRNTGPGQ